jgi:hypothetical protein
MKAPIEERLRAMLTIVKKMTLAPDTLAPADFQAALAAGASREHIRQALEVAYLFNIYDRLADAMGWDVPARDSGFYQASAKTLLSRRGYR